jgi:Carboxypeptidase regulatory-like domain/TonB dependent receptor/TonB-dependent Receptor Plug Domain
MSRSRVVTISLFKLLDFCLCDLYRLKNSISAGGLCMALRSCKRFSCSPCTRRAAITLSLAVLIFGVSVWAQDTNGRVIGIVTDPQGAAVAAAQVTVTNAGTNVSWNTVTDGKGSYQVLDVPIGMYKVTVESRGFAKATTEAQELSINQALRIDIRLKVGAANETVEVQSEAAQVETVNPTIGGTVTGKAIQDLPLNGRNTLDLALTQPGVLPIADDIGTYGTSNGGATEEGLGGISVAGGRGDAITYLLDGGMNNRTTSNQVVFNPNPEAVEEFKLLENNYTAEYGRNGGGTISVVLKSGTNALHGSLFEYLRNDDFNANDYIDNELGLPRQVLKRNQFGGVVGGPITLGKWLNGKDRLFFFFGYQGQRLSETVNEGFVTTYTPAELNGDFSQAPNGGNLLVACYLTGNTSIVLPGGLGNCAQPAHPYYQSNPALAAQGIIDPTKINSVAQSYIAAGIIPTSPTGQVFPRGSETDNVTQFVGKVDFYATKNDRISLSLGYNKEPISNPFFGANIPGFTAADTTWVSFGNIAYTKTISLSALNEVLVTAQRFYETALPTSHLSTPTQLGVNILSDDPFGPPSLSFTSGMQVGFNPNVTWKADNNYAFSDTLTWNRGRHTYKFGGRLGIIQENSVYAYQTNGIFYFDGPIGNGGIGSQDDLADFLFGASDFFSEFSKAPSNEHQRQYAVFAQDEWKATPRLTLTYGLRYEYTSPETDTHGYSFSIVPGAQSIKFPGAPLGFLVPGDPGAPRGWYYPDYTNLSPRIGIAWDPFGDGKTSIRGGGGLFFDTLNGWMSDWATDEAPWAGGTSFGFAPNQVLTNAPSPILSSPYQTGGVADPFPSQEPPPSNINFLNAGFTPFLGSGNNFVNIHLKTPFIYQYNLSVERQLANGLMAEVGYVGSSSHKLLTWVDQNPFILGTNTRILNQQLLASNPNADPQTYGYAPTFDGLNHANYNGLLASLTKRAQDVRYIGNVFFTSSYTWSHNLDNGTGFNSRVASIPYYNHNEFYGNSDFDLRQRFALSGGWELPFAKTWEQAPKRLTSGWSLYPIYFIQSGIPLDFLAGGIQSNTDPGPSGAGDGEIVRADQMVSSAQTFNPRTIQTFNGATGNFWFNPNDFQLDACISAGTCPLGFYGTYRRNSFHGPRHSNLDLALEKSTDLVGERTKLIFRAEAFNIFNHAEFRPPAATSVTSGTFGQISGTYAPRILQLALKLSF